MKEYFLNKFNDELIKKIFIYDNYKDQKIDKEIFLLNKFKQDFNLLEESLNITQCHYVHCMKINKKKKKREFDNYFVLNQIRHMGIFDTISFMQKGFFYRLSFKEFYLKYEDVIEIKNKPDRKEISKGIFDMKEMTIKVIQEICPEYLEKKDEYLLGKSCILMKMRIYNYLNKYRRDIISEKEKWVTKFATVFRSRRIRRVNFFI